MVLRGLVLRHRRMVAANGEPGDIRLAAPIPVPAPRVLLRASALLFTPRTAALLLRLAMGLVTITLPIAIVVARVLVVRRRSLRCARHGGAVLPVPHTAATAARVAAAAAAAARLLRQPLSLAAVQRRQIAIALLLGALLLSLRHFLRAMRRRRGVLLAALRR